MEKALNCVGEIARPAGQSDEEEIMIGSASGSWRINLRGSKRLFLTLSLRASVSPSAQKDRLRSASRSSLIS